jgi:hypothetical protein
MLPVLVAKLHPSVVPAKRRMRARKFFDLRWASRETCHASIFLEQAGFKAMFSNQIYRLTSAKNAL